jgi:predicted DNA repair protein MutK
MPTSSLFALIDDIATLLDDVSVMTKVATKKTAGVLGDDLALNAQQVTGINADRELPVVWAVAKGSVVNKAILVPAALAISALEAWLRSRGIGIPLITPLLMIGGAFLCFEGVEKLAHKFLHSRQEDEAHHAELVQAVQDEKVDMVAFEKDKIKGAVRTDFILSAEIIVITLGTVATAAFSRQLATLVAISAIMTVGVYGLVGGIVKLDDLGLALVRAGSGAKAAIGRAILAGAPYLMKFLSIAGTAAMFLVGGHILVEGIEALHHASESIGHMPAGWLLSMLFDAAVGIAAGLVVLLAVKAFSKLRGRKA